MSKRKGSKAKAAVWAAVALIVVLLAGLMIFRAARGKGAIIPK